MAVIRTCYSLYLLLSIILTTASMCHSTALASSEKPSKSISSHLSRNPNLESKVDSKTPLWCVAKNSAEDSTLQSALDWTCGPGGADCGPIQQGGPCYDPNNLQNMASYAFNDYFLKHGTTRESCNFGNTGDLTSLDPSNGKCVFPSSSLVLSGSFGGTAQVGPTGADINGCQAISRWSWTLIISPLVFTSTLLAFLI
ncbi:PLASMODESMATA CALLOSE-BINDING PROTEIN 5-like [Telopea speciosissima]|uniref:PLASMODESMATA CALLOSE-BINDING PROTEIN 5-like n=1 Tax=Telopea speciosissima TaxID=54955 RepID=UPI001CC485E4|nr:PLASMODESMATA CALLOSE-BINDING PROTEIN 5-like [Telopea speciosissima]XP_043689603.1 PLASMODESMATA CALLOSE-BINDING PROTEIN 5-like [Telopea speciosissima]